VGGRGIAPFGRQQITLLTGQRRRGYHGHLHTTRGRGERPLIEQRAALVEQVHGARGGAGEAHFARHGVRRCAARECAARAVEREGDGDGRRGPAIAHELRGERIEGRAREEEHGFHGGGGRRQLHVHDARL